MDSNNARIAWMERNNDDVAAQQNQLHVVQIGVDKPRIVRLKLEANVQYIDRRKTLLSCVIPSKRVLSFITALYKGKIMGSVMMTLWLGCTVLFFSYVYKRPIISEKTYIILQSLQSLNFSLGHSAFIRMDVAKAMTKSFSFWYTMWNIFVCHICALFVWGLSAPTSCMVIHSFTSIFFVMVFYDAHAFKLLPFLKISTVLGVSSYAIIAFGVQFNLIDLKSVVLEDKEKNIQYLDLKTQIVDSLFIMIIYFLRVIYNHLVKKQTSKIAFLSHYYEIDGKPSSRNIPYRSLNEPPKGGRNTVPSGSNQPAKSSKVEGKNINSIPVVPYISENKSNNSNNSNLDENAIDENQNPVENTNYHPETHLKIGIMESKYVEYDLTENIYHKYIRNRYPFVSKILRSKIYSLSGLILGTVPSYMSLPLIAGLDFGAAYKWFTIIGALMNILNILFQIIVTSNWYLVRSSLSSFDFWYVIFLIVKIFISFGILCDWDYKLAYISCSLIGFLWCMMIDAFGVSRRMLSYVSATGIVWMLNVGFLCKFSVGGMFQEEMIVSFYGIDIMSPRMVLSGSLLSSVLFILRFLWSYHRNPKRFLFITENVVVEKIPK